jgi:hypothetical protein
MTIAYSRQGLHGRSLALHRLLEILPGATSWTILLGFPLLAFFYPMTAAAVVIAFNLYWLLRLAHSTIFLVLSYLLLRAESRTDWMARLRDLRAAPPPPPAREPWRGRVSRWLQQQRLAELQADGRPPADPSRIHHLVILPIVRERAGVVEPGLRSLLAQDFPPRRMLVLLAVEERADPEVRADAERLCTQYRDQFLDVQVAVHPDGVPGEARVKGANASHAARQAAEWFSRNGIAHEDVIASCFDADTVVSPRYFSCLTYHFVTEPNRSRASFQPIPTYHNNIWEAPGFARVLDVGSSFFQLIEATNPDRLVTFSSHSMSFKALVDIGYWPVDMISDDSAIFWKAYLHFEGDYRVVPMYTTLSMDVVAADTWWRTLVGLYKQKRRWAWGVENFPLIVRGFLASRRIPWREKFRHTVKMVESHIAWATWGFMLTAYNWLPALFAGREFSISVLYYSAPRVTGIIFNLAGLAMVTTIALSLLLLPRPVSRRPRLRRLLHALEWFTVPVITLFFSALPALDAQTRLMLGKRMEFWVAGKRK